MTNTVYIAHHGVKGQKWGIRRFQNPDGTLSEEGKKHYGVSEITKKRERYSSSYDKFKERSSRSIDKKYKKLGSKLDNKKDKLLAKDPDKYITEKAYLKGLKQIQKQKLDDIKLDDYINYQSKIEKVIAASTVVGGVPGGVIAGVANRSSKLYKINKQDKEDVTNRVRDEYLEIMSKKYGVKFYR